MVSQGWLDDSCPSVSMQSASQVPSLLVGGISSKQHRVARANFIFFFFFHFIYVIVYVVFTFHDSIRNITSNNELQNWNCRLYYANKVSSFVMWFQTVQGRICSSSRPYKCFPTTGDNSVTNLAAITAVRKPICTSHKYNPDKVGSGSLPQQDGRSCSPVVDPWKPQQQQMKTVRRKGGVRSCTTCTNIIQIFIFNVLICNLTS